MPARPRNFRPTLPFQPMSEARQRAIGRYGTKVWYSVGIVSHNSTGRAVDNIINKKWSLSDSGVGELMLIQGDKVLRGDVESLEINGDQDDGYTVSLGGGSFDTTSSAPVLIRYPATTIGRANAADLHEKIDDRWH